MSTSVEQLSVFDFNPLDNRIPGYRKRGKATEKQASKDAFPHSGSQRLKVLMKLAEAGAVGATDYELGTSLGILRTSAGKRRKELLEDGLVTDTGERRITDTGSSAVVWALTPEGSALVESHRGPE